MNRAVVVTGASTGIGAAIARHLTGRGFRVFGTVRRAEDGMTLERDGVTAVRMDVTDTASIARAQAEVERALRGAPCPAPAASARGHSARVARADRAVDSRSLARLADLSGRVACRREALTPV